MDTKMIFGASLILLGGLVSCQNPQGDPRMESRDFDLLESTVGAWIHCALGDDQPSECLETRTIRQIRALSSEMKIHLMEDVEESRAAKSMTEADGEHEEDARGLETLSAENEKIARKIDEEKKSEQSGLLDEIGDFFAGGLLKFFDDVFGTKEEDTSAAAVDSGEKSAKALEGGRGHKKKYLKKQNKKLKIILILMLIKNKIKMFLQKFQFLLQLKFLGIALANLLINLVRLWLELKKKHKPNKVIYYEKSHHQHHYDNEHIHDEPDDHYYSHPGSYKHYGHHEEEQESGGFWPWSRSYIEPKTNDIWGNPPFRRPGSHNMVYMNQRPIR